MTFNQAARPDTIDVSGVQQIAQDIYRQVAVIFLNHLGPDLVSLVAHGSAVKGGMIAGSSDIDYVVFVAPEILTPGGELPLGQALGIHRDLARIGIAPFRYVQGLVAAAGSGPAPGFIPGTYQVVTGSPDVPVATGQGLLETAAHDLARLDITAIRDRLSNALLDHGEGRLSRQVRGLATWVWPAMYQVAALALNDGLAAWQQTKPEVVAMLGDDPVVGPPVQEWMTAITRHHAVGESVATALAAIGAGVAFLDATALWYRERLGRES
jgi:hypothetical protein